jgi:hypothetical protein
MESVASYYTYWAVYMAAALIGYWCWGRMAFWVAERGVVYHLYSAVGAVLIFTPLPVTGQEQTLAPGFVAIAFTFISEGFSGVYEFAVWYLASTVLAGIALIVGLILIKPEAKAKASVVKREQPSSVPDNPFR